MKDLVERFLSRVRGREIGPDDYRQELLTLCDQAGDIRERSKIRFDYKMRRKKILTDKMEIERIVKDVVSYWREMVGKRNEAFKKIANNYKYFHKDIE